MKKITNLLIVCSLALAGAVMAQQPAPEESQSPGKKTDKKAPAEVKPKGPKAPKTETPAAAPKTEAPAKPETPAVKEPASAPKTEAPAATEPAATKPDKKAKADKKSAPAATAPETKPSAEEPATSAAPADKKQSRKDKKAADANAKTSPAPAAAASTAPSTPAAKTTPAAATAPTVATTPAAVTTPATATTPATTPATVTSPAAATTATSPATTASVAPATAASASVAPTVSQTTTTAAVKKPDPQKVQQIQQRTATFTAQPRPDRVPAVTFSTGYRIQGADQWQGPRYEVYRSYRPERHDQNWYRSRYQRVELIAGGYYYFHNNYWYPAWGYSPREEYYAYDAPIYAGKRALPPDKVIAEVQAVLQDMGYYKGEVDGLLGPLTREALTGYQRDNGMTVTAVIDEPTLDSLGMS